MNKHSIDDMSFLKYITLSIMIYILLTPSARAEKNPILAEYGRQKFTLKDFESNLLIKPDEASEKLTREEKEQLLIEIIRLEVYAKEASSLGFGKKKDIRERVKNYKNYILATEYLKNEVQAKLNSNEKEIDEYFEANRLKYTEPEKIKTRQIFIQAKTVEEEEVASAKAQKILTRLLVNKEHFASLAERFSDDSVTKNIGGDMGYFARGRLAPELEESVFRLKDGEISPVLRSTFGFHIFLLEDRKPGRLLYLSEVREKIKEDLKAEKEQNFHRDIDERLFKKYNVKIYKGMLSSLP